MTIEIKEIEVINEISNKVDLLLKAMNSNVDKRWLTINELSQYIGYSTNTVYKMINVDFILDIHYFKPNGKVLFDKNAIDNWIIKGGNHTPCNVISNSYIDKLLA